MTPDVIVAIAVPAIVQGGGFMFWAGVTWSTLRNHDRRIGKLETKTDRTAETVAKLEGELS